MDPQELQPNDSIGVGFLIAFACQLFIMVAIVFIFRTVVVLVYWGLYQWIALLPLYFWSRSKAYPLRAKGVLIAGFLGMLLNAACAAALFTLYAGKG